MDKAYPVTRSDAEWRLQHAPRAQPIAERAGLLLLRAPPKDVALPEVLDDKTVHYCEVTSESGAVRADRIARVRLSSTLAAPSRMSSLTSMVIK